MPPLFPEIPGSGWSGVHHEPRHLYLSSEAGKTLWGKFLSGRGEAGGNSSARRAPLRCCSAFLFWPQLCCGAPGLDVTKLVSTLLLPHPHPFPVAVISGQALRIDCSSSLSGYPQQAAQVCGGLGIKVGRVQSEVGELGSCAGILFHTPTGVERASSWSQPCH